jgi:putative endonuclease
MPYVYIVRCRDGSLYTGSAKVLARRVAQHAAGIAAKYTRSRLPVVLVWSRRVASWSAALRLEIRIKALPRSAKLALIGNPTATPVPRLRRRRSPAR